MQPKRITVRLHGNNAATGYFMLTFYNWRIKRSGACLRIIGVCRTQEGAIINGHKISNVGAIELRNDNALIAKDRDGKDIAELRCKVLSPQGIAALSI